MTNQKRLMPNLRRIDVPGHAPEDTLFDDQGHIYTGLKNGNAILRVDLGSAKVTVIAEPGGRPLGLDWLPDGRLLLCNAELGLQAINVKSGKVESLPISGQTLHLCNNAHVLPDGTIYVSDSSSKFELDDYPKDMIQNTSTGRLLKISPDGEATLLLDGLCFANGVAYLADQQAVLVAATGTCEISRVDLKTGKVTKFADVDGHPDNISIGSDGRVWVAVPSIKNDTLATVHKLPLPMRRLISNLPKALQPKPKLCCHVQVFNPDGSLHASYAGDPNIYHLVTGVREKDGVVAMGSIEQESIAIFELDG